MQHFPAAGVVVTFDRSWYNRVGVEYVMGFCTKDQYWQFVENCPKFESHIVKAGILLIKFWLEVCQEEQQRRLPDIRAGGFLVCDCQSSDYHTCNMLHDSAPHER